MSFNLLNELDAYAFGFILTDGTMSIDKQNRGRISIELKKSDVDVLNKISRLFQKCSITYRLRNTNYIKNYESAILRVNSLTYVKELNKLGIPIGKKSEIINIPNSEFSKKDFLRGIIDGDGSLGFLKNGDPFISFVTASESLKEFLIDFLFDEKIINYKKINNRNKRDGLFNICLRKKDAQNFVNFLYKDSTIYMNRKKEIADKISLWKRRF